MPTLPPERLAAAGSLSWLDRIRLTQEISAAHRRVRRAQSKTDDVREVLLEVRDGPLAAAGPPAPPEVASRLGYAVSRAMPRLPADSRCLAQSLVLCDLLARRGLTGKLIIGVKGDSEFGAHAWVELDGTPMLEPGEFGRLAEL
jgi:hypothetical protein